MALDQGELPRLADIEARATAKAVLGLTRLSHSGIRDLEPNAVGLAALHSSRAGITDFAAVARSYARDVQAGGAVATTCGSCPFAVSTSESIRSSKISCGA